MNKILPNILFIEADGIYLQIFMQASFKTDFKVKSDETKIMTQKRKYLGS